MENIGLWIYLASTFDTLSLLMGLMVGISAIFLGAFLIVYLANPVHINEDKNEKKEYLNGCKNKEKEYLNGIAKKGMKISTRILILSIILVVIIPDRKTTYAMTIAPVAVDAFNTVRKSEKTEQLSSIIDKTFQLVDQRLEQELSKKSK